MNTLSTTFFNKRSLLYILAAIASGTFTSLLFDPFNEFGALWIALVPLLMIVRKTSPKVAFWTGWLTGIITWAIQLHWFSRLTETGGFLPVVYLGYGILVIYLGFYIGAFAYLAAILRKKLLNNESSFISGKRILLCTLLEPALWVALEVIRSHLFTGFAWNPLGLSFTMNLPVFQLTSIGGVSLVSALIIALNGAVTSLFERIWWSIRRELPDASLARLMLSLETCFPFLLFLIAFLWGAQRIKAYDAYLTKHAQPLNILIQTTQQPALASPTYKPTNFFQRIKRDASFINILKNKQTFHLWLMPETSFIHCDLADLTMPKNEIIKDFYQTLQDIASTTAPLLLGGTYSENGNAYNASTLITPNAFIPSKHLYRKRHLVPFGEYIPFDKTFPILQKLVPTGVSCSAGDETIITLPSGHCFGPLICFDDCDASLSRESVNDGAQFLVNTSNDVWFTPSIEPVAHLRQAIARCIETGVPMVRSSNTGGAAYIDAVGRICYRNRTETILKNYMTSPTKLTLICEDQVDQVANYTCHLPITKVPFTTAYLLWGEILVALPCLLFTLGFIFWCVYHRYRQKIKPSITLSLLIFGIFCMPNNLQAETLEDYIDYRLLPTAAMAIDDGNISIAEETANTILSELGLTPERRAKTVEILIRSDLKKSNYDAAIEHINSCPELPVEQRLVFLMLAYTGKKDYTKVNDLYEDADHTLTSEWNLSALRLALIADLQLGNKLRAAERFTLVHKSTDQQLEIRAANALAWNQAFPSPAARDALLQAAEYATKGGLFLECAFQLPVAFHGISDTRPLATIKRVLTQKDISAEMKAKLSYIGAQLSLNFNEKIAYAEAALDTTSKEDKRRAYILLGDSYLAKENEKEKGLDYLKRAIIMNPSAKDAPYTQLRIAETYMEMNRLDLALKEYDRYRQSYALPELTIRYLQGYGRALYRNNNPLDAVETFAKALVYVKDDNAKKIELLAEAAQAATSAKRYDRAIQFLQQRLEIDVQKRPTITLAIAHLYEQKEDIKQASDLYASICNMPNVDEDDLTMATLRLGSIYMNAGRATDAIARYTTSMSRLAEDAPSKQQIQLARGKAYYTTTQYQRAHDDFQKIKHAENPEISNEAHFFLVLCLYRLGHDDEAHALANEYIAYEPDHARVPDILLWLAKSDFNKGNYNSASKGYATFINRWENDPRVPQILYLEALSNFYDQHYRETLQSIARLAKDHPNAPILPDARFLQAQALIQHARHAEARDILLDLIAQHPNALWLGEAYGYLGDCLSITSAETPSRLEAAITAYRNAITRLETNDADKALSYRFKIGRIYEKQNYRPDAAEEYYRLLYILLNQPTSYTNNGILWANRALVRLTDIETAAGHTNKLQQLKARIRHTNIPGLTTP